MGDSDLHWVNKDGESVGPYGLDEIRRKVEEGFFDPGDHICTVGEDEWVSISKALDLVPDEDFAQEEETDEGKRIVLKGGAGGALNTILTVILVGLGLACIAFYFLGGSFEADPGIPEHESGGGEKQASFDRVAAEGNATDASGLEEREGRVFLLGADEAFSGWSVRRFFDTDQVADLVEFENGRPVRAFSWKPDGEECPLSSFSKGSGRIVGYYANGNRMTESSYSLGLLNGMRMTWHEDGQKSEESFFKDGKLHGRMTNWHPNGQKAAETFYADGLKDGRYALWHNDGQKYDEGSYRSGKRDGSRTLRTKDGTMLKEETYQDGELVSDDLAQIDPPPDAENPADPVVAPMFDVTALAPEFKAKADELSLIVKRVEDKFAEQNPQGEDSFAALAVALFNYNAYKGKQVEADNLVVLKDAFSLFRTSWGMQAGVKDKEFALSVMPDEISLGSLRITSEEYARGTPVSPSDLSYLVGETEQLFSSIGLELEKDSSFYEREFSSRLWKGVLASAMKSKSAGLVVRNGILVLKDTDKIQVKSIDKRGNSVFTEEEQEVERPLTQRAMDEKMEKYLKALELAGASFEDVQSKTNPRLMVRKYENLVFLPAEGEDVLYPNVSVMLAGLNPLNADALIRAIRVEIGEPLRAP